MSKKLAEQVNAVLALLQGGVLTKGRAAAIVKRIFEMDADGSLGVSPDNSKNDGTGCTEDWAPGIGCTLVSA